MTSSRPRVGLIMGSQSDWSTLRHAATTLDELAVPFERRIVSAHRTPDRLVRYANGAKERGIEVIIAGAGGAAHLPGMVAAMTTLPVLGTLAIGRAGAINAALLAAAILALKDEAIAAALADWRARQTAAVAETPTDPADGS